MDVEEDKEERKDEEMKRFYMIENWRSFASIPHQTQNRVFVLTICKERTKGREHFLSSLLGHKNEGNGSFVDSDVSFSFSFFFYLPYNLSLVSVGNHSHWWIPQFS